MKSLSKNIHSFNKQTKKMEKNRPERGWEKFLWVPRARKLRFHIWPKVLPPTPWGFLGIKA